MGEDEAAYPAVAGQTGRLHRRQMVEALGQVALGVGEGGLAHEQVGPLGQRVRPVAQAGVHHHRYDLARAPNAHVLEPHHVATRSGQRTLALEHSHVRPGHAGGGEQLRHHGPALGLLEPPAEGLRGVVEPLGDEPVGRCGDDFAGTRDRMLHHLHVLLEGRRVEQTVGVDRPAGRIVEGDGAGHLIERHPLHDTGKPEAVVAVEVRDADAGDGRRAHSGEEHLALGPLARIEQDGLVVPAQDQRIVVAGPGRRLAGRAEHHELPHRPSLPAWPGVAARRYRPLVPAATRPRRRPRPVFAAGIVAAVALTCAACSSSPGSSGSSTTTSAAGSSTSTGAGSGSTAANFEWSPAGTWGTKPTVVVPSGSPPKQLLTHDLIVGTGATIQSGQTVTMQYVGYSWSSKQQFDASWDRGQPFSFTFGVGQVIPGWDQGLAGMKVGGRRELVIPPALGYGSSSPGPGIAANDTLVFVVDLVNVG
ncbi:MAG TPA: FKBP-type peptidyl-prolyl cis-trans isomerase [Acidimicrobiales bacterium]|nr:FKBP-type peptidyl-prolyl cis-trans isomerase [Acidimicrobiales bacterium]